MSSVGQQQQEEIVTMSKKETMEASLSAEQPPLQRLVGDLRKHFDQFGNGPEGAQRVSTMMSDYIHNHEDWKDYALYHPAFYARNLVECNDHFELIVICWKDGQKSPIHNHAGSSCWMGCLEGQIEETYYHVKDEPETGPEEGICPNLIKGQTEEHTKGEVAYIRDEIALHVIRPLDGNGVSLHLYSPPIKSCLIYIPALGKTARKTVGYYTINKQRCNDD
jgi:cysteine dioxygenase